MAEHSGSIVGLTASHNNDFVYSHDLIGILMHVAKKKCAWTISRKHVSGSGVKSVRLLRCHLIHWICHLALINSSSLLLNLQSASTFGLVYKCEIQNGPQAHHSWTSFVLHIQSEGQEWQDWLLMAVQSRHPRYHPMQPCVRKPWLPEPAEGIDFLPGGREPAESATTVTHEITHETHRGFTGRLWWTSMPWLLIPTCGT